MKLKNLVNTVLDKVGIGIVGVKPKGSVLLAMDLFNKKSIKVIEIGTLKGETAESILKQLNVEKIYLIDPYEDSEEYPLVHLNEKKAKNKLKRYSDKTIWLKYGSDEAVKKITEKVDFIYIDGSHIYEQVKKDLNNYWDLLKEGGIFSGHDISGYEDVTRAVTEFCSERKLNFKIRRQDWIIFKKAI